VQVHPSNIYSIRSLEWREAGIRVGDTNERAVSSSKRSADDMGEAATPWHATTGRESETELAALPGVREKQTTT